MTTLATSAPIHGPRWSARAADWAELVAGFSQPAWAAVADATGIAAGTRVLDLGCGSGEFCRLAAARGAHAFGIDAAQAMIEIAARQAPGADLRVGAIERLPYDDASFDSVCAFNAIQFAAEPLAALTEARRVTRAHGQVAICTWTRPEDSDLFAASARYASSNPPRLPPLRSASPARSKTSCAAPASRHARAPKSPCRSNSTPRHSNVRCSLPGPPSPPSNTPANPRSAPRSSTPPRPSNDPTAPTTSTTASST
jgi:SAM-dependent methyltransferase